MTYRLTPRANRDISEIAEHIAADNPSAALKLLVEFESVLDLISEFPKAGALREELGKGIRFVPKRPYLIFYELAKEGVLVLRILHGAKHLSSELLKP